MKFVVIITFVFFGHAPLLAQNGHFNLDELLKNNKPDEIRQRVQSEIRKNKGTPLGLYLEAFLETDAAKAVEIYQKVLRKFPGSREAEAALHKTAQYYFSRGLYVTARKHFLELIERYPKSEYVDDSMYSGAACLYAAGKYRSCYVELNNFLIKNPNSPLRPLALDDLKELRGKTGDTRGMERASKSGGKYALQIGAFSKRANADKLMSYCETLGLPVEIHERKGKSKTLYLVWLGSFESAEDSRTFGDKFKREHGKPYRVVER